MWIRAGVSKLLCRERVSAMIDQECVTLWCQKAALQASVMEFDYSIYRNREGTFYHPCINLTFKYKSKSFPYESAIVDTGSDFILLPLSIAEALGAEPDFESVTELNCACGSTFKSYSSRYPLGLNIDHTGFRPHTWETHVKFVQPEVTVLLGHRGFLDRLDASFFGKRHVLKLEAS